MKIILSIFDFISPRFCVSCNATLITHKYFICNECYSKISILQDHEIKSEFNRKFKKDNLVDDYSSLFLFEEKGPLQDLIHNLKYKQKFKIGILLGEKLGEGKKNIITNWNVDFIIPIPLFHLKKIERGYNQAMYIAKGLSKASQINVKTNIVKRVKNTLSQTKLSNDERKGNMLRAFRVKNSKSIKGKNIIVIDDVITTGTTVLELAKILKENGANKIFCLSIATPPFLHSIGSSNTKN
ncbi:MAG: ComF family protein [Melioribacteraceae bacterium]|nr:ComF family protein [Melioribacteraceae bacterium]